MNNAIHPTVPASPALAEFTLLESWLASGHAAQLPLHAVESEQHMRGREVQRLLLQAHLDLRGHGDAGPALSAAGPDGRTQRYTHRRLSTRTITTIFGPVNIERLGYSHPGAPSIYPLDQILALPARSFSYELQRRLVMLAVLNPFQESAATIATLTGVPKRSLEAVVRDAAQDFDAFYQQQQRVSEPGSGPILVAAIDCKGIPMVKQKTNAPASPRLTKGQKANRKRMATVAVVFTRQPWVRTPEQVIESLFRSRTKEESALLPAPPRPENKRVWASLTKGKAAVTDEVAAEMQRRMERSGMRWTESMAEAVVKLRAVYLSGDFDQYWLFHIRQEQSRLHATPWTVVPK